MPKTLRAECRKMQQAKTELVRLSWPLWTALAALVPMQLCAAEVFTEDFEAADRAAWSAGQGPRAEIVGAGGDNLHFKVAKSLHHF